MPEQDELIPAEGCRHCGVPERGHCRQWALGVGWHLYEVPSRAQVQGRLRALLFARRVNGVTDA